MNVPHEQSPGLIAIPDVHHAFFGREGGLSQGVFASLNLSESVGDDPEVVGDNRKLVTAALGFEPHRLTLVKQTHSAHVVTITGPHAGPRVEADAMVTARTGIALGILTADCTPILLADQLAGVVGAIHAGWRGAADNIIAATIKAMVALGAEPSRLITAIGPTISGVNYEVGEPFMTDFLALQPHSTHRFIQPPGARVHFDLPGFVADQLEAAGVHTIDKVGGCTYADPQRYFSHRFATHSGARTGRQIAIIGLG